MLLIQPWEKIQADPELKASLEEAMLEFELFAGGMEGVEVYWQPKRNQNQECDYSYHAKWHRQIADLADQAYRKQEEEEY